MATAVTVDSPLAFNSIAGGDFAAAIAAGNPVIAKANTSHPGTTRLFAEEARTAAEETGLPAATGDGLPRAGGEGLAFGLAVGARSAIMAVGVAAWGDPAGVGGLETLVAGEPGSELLLQAAISTPSTAASTNR